MPEYKPYIADPENYKRHRVSQEEDYEKYISQVYLRRLNLFTRDELVVFVEELKRKFNERESTWWTRVWGQIWYNLFLPNLNEVLTVKQVFKLLSKTDQLIKYLPQSKWVYLLRGIDWVADLAYESLDK